MQKNLTEALVVHCIDFRIQGHLNRWIEENLGEGNYDRVALAGSVLNFDVIFEQVKTAERLHEIKKVVLINHEDCGAYGAAGTKERHAADLRAAGEAIVTAYPHLAVETFYIHLNGSLEPLPNKRG